MENHLTELLDGLIEEAYSEATCREPDARLMQVARHSGEAPRRRGWAAEPSFRAFAPGGDSARELTPGSRSRGSIRCGEPGFPPTGPPRRLRSDGGLRSSACGVLVADLPDRRHGQDRAGEGDRCADVQSVMVARHELVARVSGASVDLGRHHGAH